MIIRLDDIEIRPKQRMRTSGISKNGKMLKFSPTKKHEEGLAFTIMANAPVKKMIEHECYVHAKIYSKAKLLGDSDNYIKTILDAMQKSKIIKNDRQVKDERCTLIGEVPISRVIIEVLPFKDALSIEDRILIEKSKRQSASNREIARAIGVSHTIVNRHLKNWRVKWA